ncbi:hypothetical protein [Pseudonocardia sp. NPDC049154]|uniref:hypothetical protein n=1 Tax=Pseudonocardia sp. NPDC049154 TaxID=3155501 RepID=UPI0033D210FE
MRLVDGVQHGAEFVADGSRGGSVCPTTRSCPLPSGFHERTLAHVVLLTQHLLQDGLAGAAEEVEEVEEVEVLAQQAVHYRIRR